MTDQEAVKLLDSMRSVFPAATIGPEGVRNYVEEMRTWRYDLGKDAVQSAIRVCRFLPTIAELSHHYRIAVEQNRRRVDAERQRLERLREDEQPRPPLKEIPDAVGYLAKLHTDDVDALLNLEELDPGKCDDCRKEPRPLFKFGQMRVCSTCIGPRLRERGKLEAAS